MHIPATVLAQIIRLIDTTPIGPLADLLVGAIEATYTERLQILDAYDINVRLMRVISLLQRQIEVLKLSRQIRSSAETKLNKKQREYYLRQQLKAIRAELGEASHSGGSNGNPLQQQQDDEYSDLIKQLDSAEMPAEVEIVAQRELKRLRRMNPAMAEHSTTRTYLEWLSEMPWNKMSTDQSDISQAKRQLDADNYGMEKAKKRIIEYMAVRPATTTARSPILCLTGSPGVGKSSLGRSIAKALGRQFYRISLGGVSDEAEIRGHRRTYVGSMPGLFIQAMRRCGVRNPVILLDEIDKMGSSSHRGDPDAALLEVLDPELNNTFRDHYLGVPFDLSQVLFVATANSIHNISHALYDRLEIVDIDGYTMNEKLQIAKTYLIPKQLDLHGLGSNNTANSNNSSDAELDSNIVDIPDESVMHIINCYTYESGVRNLERRIASVCRRKAADFVELLETTPDSIGRVRKWTSRVSVEDVDSILNVRPYDSPLAEKTAVPGVVTGLLFVTSGNGEIGFIEARKMPGKGAMHLTGMLGSVLQESAQIALSYIRDNARALGISTDDKEDIFKEIDLHIHMPAGSIRKEGPSAGITILTALVSLFLARRVSPYLAMTGELTLRGHVKAIGGVREKVLAAHRAGIKMVILPEENRKDYNKDVPEEVRKEMQATFASRAEQVLNVALNYDEDTQSIVESPIVVGLTHRL
ncbi:ATP-dependent protease La [Ramicandelaber brevisporus]|nr:ATP-dependent protease La [Ramicandelaber brevisporus]